MEREAGAALEDAVFRALSDATRRAVLVRLGESEANVSDLVATAGGSQSAVSQHLKVLRDVGLVTERRDGRMRVYSLTAEPLLVVRDWLAHYERFWAERLDRLGGALRARHGQDDPL